MLISKVKGHEGPCKATWINSNQACIRLDGVVTGFFKTVKKRFGFYVKYGEEFHGVVKPGGIIKKEE